jgi:hypothetical protein
MLSEFVRYPNSYVAPGWGADYTLGIGRAKSEPLLTSILSCARSRARTLLPLRRWEAMESLPSTKRKVVRDYWPLTCVRYTPAQRYQAPP